jgi:hypothetical protein
MYENIAYNFNIHILNYKKLRRDVTCRKTKINSLNIKKKYSMRAVFQKPKQINS